MSDFSCHAEKDQKGFTLIEMLITMVIALVILGGLLLSFTQQNSEYKYQNKRIDAVQDLEFGIKFVAEDLRSALIDKDFLTSSIAITNYAGTDPYTSTVTFDVWDNAYSASANKRATRKYLYNVATKSLRYDREITGGDATVNDGSQILPHVTFFKVFNDSDTGTYPRGAFSASGIPTAQSTIQVRRPDGANANVPGYTILIEMEVDAGYKQGVLQDVKGAATTTKRVWRYVQVYPLTVVD